MRTDLRQPLEFDPHARGIAAMVTIEDILGMPPEPTVPAPIPQPPVDPHNFRRVITIGLAVTTSLLLWALPIAVYLAGRAKGWW